jgi:phage tail tape-measure protein
MALIEREIALAVGATAVALSPKARSVARKGAVYGLAGALKVGDMVSSTARGAGRGAQEGVRGPSVGVGAERSRASKPRASKPAARRRPPKTAATS